MPSPFPGMDPFLEHPEIFPDFHDAFIANLRASVQAQLPPPYIATLGRRAWIEVSERFVGPDVQVSRGRSVPGESESALPVAVVARPRTEPLVIHVPHDERREPFVEIYLGRGSDRRLVTSIEMLSLTNKTRGEHGRDLYLCKQQEILGSKVHLLEIDLLRAGEHTTAVPQHRLARAAGEFDYHVSIHHFDNLEHYFVYPIRLDESLPNIAVPLLPSDPSVPLDLQAVFQRTYDEGPYHREIRYREDTPTPPLRETQRPWLERLLR
jgi:hypothetical protein